MATATTTGYVIRRSAQRPVAIGGYKYMDGDRYYSHSVGATIYWTASPWAASVYTTAAQARVSAGWSWQCEAVAYTDATAEAMGRRE